MPRRRRSRGGELEHELSTLEAREAELSTLEARELHRREIRSVEARSRLSREPSRLKDRGIKAEIIDDDRLHPALTELGDELLTEFKAAAVRVARGFDLPSSELHVVTWEELAKARLGQLERKSHNKVISILKEMYDDARFRSEHLGRFADADLSERDILNTAPSRLPDSLPIVKIIKGALPKPPPRPQAPPAQEEQTWFVDFRLIQVYCQEETDEPSDSDEILLGGVAVDATAATSKILTWKVSDDFDAGETVQYTPHRQLRSFQLNLKDNVWPKVFLVSLTMAEEDDGGFPGWLDKFYNKVRDKVADWLGKLAENVPVVGFILKEIVPWLAKEVLNFIKWLFGNSEDDIIQTRHYSLTLQKGQPREMAFPVQKVSYVGDDATYWVWTYWQTRKLAPID